VLKVGACSTHWSLADKTFDRLRVKPKPEKPILHHLVAKIRILCYSLECRRIEIMPGPRRGEGPGENFLFLM
jgi:hypothetical protein